MASSVNRRIETDLSRAMGQCDLAGLIRPRSTEPIRACGLRPRQQAGHMTASDLQLQTRGKLLASRGPSTHEPVGQGRATMRWLSTLAIILGCAACQPQPDGTQVSALPGQPQPPQGQAELACHDFTAPVTAAGNPEQASGQACGQPDGSWRVVQNTPGLPAQTYVVPSPSQPTATATSTAAQPAPNQPPCSSYTASVTVGGQPQQAVIEACPLPDGSWRVTQNTPGLPTQVYEVPPPTSS